MVPVIPPKAEKKSKKELSALADKYKNAIEDQLEGIKEKGLDIGKTALIIGGIAFGGYILFDLFFGEKEKSFKKAKFLKLNSNKLSETKNTKDSWVVSSIKGYILAFILGIAKEKLLEALAEFKKEETTTK